MNGLAERRCGGHSVPEGGPGEPHDSNSFIGMDRACSTNFISINQSLTHFIFLLILPLSSLPARSRRRSVSRCNSMRSCPDMTSIDSLNCIYF